MVLNFIQLELESLFGGKMFSVIIPNYNNARYLDELFESIINQTFENYEIIFIDDVSEDDSLEKAKEWSEKFKQNFTLIENQEMEWWFKKYWN